MNTMLALLKRRPARRVLATTCVSLMALSLIGGCKDDTGQKQSDSQQSPTNAGKGQAGSSDLNNEK